MTTSGFQRPNYTQVPDALFDELLPDLSGAELKVLLYITRRTLGFRKHEDAISLTQICSGITRHDGTVIDRGTGLSRRSVVPAIRSLVQRNLLSARHALTEHGDADTTVYALRFDGTAGEVGQPVPQVGQGLPQEVGQSLREGGANIAPPVGQSLHGGRAEIAPTTNRLTTDRSQEIETTHSSSAAAPSRSVETIWTSAYGRRPSPAQRERLMACLDQEITAGMPGLTAACITYSAERSQAAGYFITTFEGCLTARSQPGAPRSAQRSPTPIAAGRHGQAGTLPPSKYDSPEAADAFNRKQWARVFPDKPYPYGPPAARAASGGA